MTCFSGITAQIIKVVEELKILEKKTPEFIKNFEKIKKKTILQTFIYFSKNWESKCSPKNSRIIP